MNIIEVMRLPLSVDLSGFVHLLQRLQVPHRVSEEGEVQVLWAPDNLAADVRELYQRYPDGNADLPATTDPVGAGEPAKGPVQPQHTQMKNKSSRRPGDGIGYAIRDF